FSPRLWTPTRRTSTGPWSGSSWRTAGWKCTSGDRWRRRWPRPSMSSRFSPAAVRAFELLFRPWMRGRGHAVHMAGLAGRDAPTGPVLLAANHVSWWDGFVLREVQRVLRPDAPLYTLMSEAQLRRFPFFRRLGVVGIDGASPPSVARAIHFLQ